MTELTNDPKQAAIEAQKIAYYVQAVRRFFLLIFVWAFISWIAMLSLGGAGATFGFLPVLGLMFSLRYIYFLTRISVAK